MKNTTIKNYFYNIIMIFLTIIYPIIIFPYVSRVLTPLYYGKYSFAVSISFYFLTLAMLGIPTYGVREISKLKLETRENFNKGFSEIFYISLISSVISYIVYLIFIFFMPILKKEINLFFLLGLQIVFSFITLDYFYIAMEQHKRRTMRLFIIKIISLISLFYFVKKPEDYIKYALIMMIPEIIAKFIDFFDVRQYLIYDFKELNLKKHMKSLTVIFFYILSTTIYLNLDSTMLGFLKGDVEVGYYNVSVKMTKIIIPLITSLGLVLAPKMIENMKKNNENELFKNMDIYLNFIFFISFPIVVLFLIFAKEIVVLFSGIDYISATIPMQVMSPIIFFISISGFSAANFLIPKGDEKKVLQISIVGLILNVVLNFLLIPKLSIIGAGIATLVAEAIVATLRFLGVKRYYPNYNMFTKERIKYIIASILSLLILFILMKLKYSNSYIKMFFISGVYGITYLLILLLNKEYFVSLGLKIIRERLKK